MFRRLAMFDAQHGSEILEDIFIGLEKMKDMRDLTAFEAGVYTRVKVYEVNSREAHENFYETLAKPPK